MLLVPTLVRAAVGTGYPCRVHQNNYSYFGSFGGLMVSYYSGANCSGAFQYTGYVCTTNASSSACPSDSRYIYTEAQLQQIFDSLIESMHHGRQVDFSYTNSCRGGGTACQETITFR